MVVKLHVIYRTRNSIEFAEPEIASGITHNALTCCFAYNVAVKLHVISWTKNRISFAEPEIAQTGLLDDAGIHQTDRRVLFVYKAPTELHLIFDIQFSFLFR